MTTINYVRLLVSAGSAAAFGSWGRTLLPFLRSSSLRRWGFALHEAFLRRVAGVSEPHVVQFPRFVSECEGCGCQSADRLGEKRGRLAGSGEVVCVLGATASVVVCCSHVNPLLRAVTRYVARKPLDMHLGSAAHAQIIGPTCGLEGPRAH